MGRLTLRILLFLLPLLLVVPLLEFSLRRIPNDYRFKKEYLDRHAGEIEVLVLGNSHTYYGVDPQYYEGSCFNAAIYSQTLGYDYEILKLYADRLEKLRVVVVSISYHSLYSLLETGPSKFRVTDYTLYYGMDVANSLKDHFELLGKQFSVNVKELVSYYIRKKKPLSCDELGWGTIHSSADRQDLDLSGATAAKRHRAYVEHAAEGNLQENLACLQDMIGLCGEMGAGLLLVTTPSFKSYYSRLDPVTMKQTEHMLNDLMAPHPLCRYVNLLEDPGFRASDFYDADHVNEVGARKLSLLLFRLAEELQVEIVSETAQ
jgi:hypothetical protein